MVTHAYISRVILLIIISRNMGSCLSSQERIAELEEINSGLCERIQVLEGSESSLAELANDRLGALMNARRELAEAVRKIEHLGRDNARVNYERCALKRRLCRRH